MKYIISGKHIMEKWNIDLPWCDHNDKWGSCKWCSAPGFPLRTTYVLKGDGGLWFKYGRIDIDAVLGKIHDKDRGPALWLLNLEHHKVCEIDIVEYIKNRLVFTLWWNYHPRRGKGRKIFRFISKRLANKMTTYSVVWERNRIRWYVNGFRVFSTRKHIPDVHLAVIIQNIHKIGRVTIETDDISTIFPRHSF